MINLTKSDSHYIIYKMVESNSESQAAANEESKIVPSFSESVNVPKMAIMNLSSVLLDP